MEQTMDEHMDRIDEAAALSEDELEDIAGGLFDVTIPVVVQLNLAVLSGGVTQGNLANLGIGK